MDDDPVEVLRRWEEHGATWQALHVSDALAVIQLCTCSGEPVERLESADPELIRFVRGHAPQPE